MKSALTYTEELDLNIWLTIKWVWMGSWINFWTTAVQLHMDPQNIYQQATYAYQMLYKFKHWGIW